MIQEILFDELINRFKEQIELKARTLDPKWVLDDKSPCDLHRTVVYRIEELRKAVKDMPLNG